MSSVTVKERPILFSGPMVRAILDGRKTQTRRVVKSQPPKEYWSLQDCMSEFFWNDTDKDDDMAGWWPSYDKGVRCPYGQPGDRLWVRETWFCVTGEPGPVTCNYKADFGDHRFAGYWKPSIHMPRWASRITLEITGVRVERLNDISEADAIEEGIEIGTTEPERFRHYTSGKFTLLPRHSFQSLWESINGAGSWDANPWVWVVEFRKVQP